MTLTLLGQGRFSEVFEVHVDGHAFAMKKVKLRGKALREAEVLKKLSHPNIVKLEGMVESEDNGTSLYIELLNQNLWDFVQEKGKKILGYKIFLQIALQIASGLDYLHNNQIVHHDIKPHNILVNDTYTAKLCDFGSASILPFGEFLQDGLGKGTTPYCAPEIFQLQKYDHKIDVYSFGVVMWFLLTGRAPFDDIPSSVAMIIAIKEGDWFESPFYCLDGSHYHPNLPKLIKSCLSVNPSQRPTASELFRSLQALALLETECPC